MLYTGKLRLLSALTLAAGLSACVADPETGTSSSQDTVSSPSEIMTSSSELSSSSILPLSSAPSSPAPVSSDATESSSSVVSSEIASSSSSAESSSSESSSSEPNEVTLADAVLNSQTRAYYDGECSGCHVHKGDGVFTALTSPDFQITDVVNSRGGFSGLVDYVESDMPFNGGDSCVGQCAIDSSAWMLEIAKEVALSCDDNTVATGFRTVRLLNIREYKNSLIDLGLIDDEDFKDSFEYTSGAAGKSSYPLNTNTQVIADRFRKMQSAAEALSKAAAEKLKQSTGCGNNCTSAFMQKAEMLYRRPLSAEETASFNKIFADFGGDAGLETALHAALLSPDFLYRSEVGVSVAEARQMGWNIQSADGSNLLDKLGPNDYVLSPYEFATALAFMYTGSTPDRALLDAARNNGLNSENQILNQIDRLIDSPRGRAHIADFGATWFRTDAVRNAVRVDAKLTDEIKNDMAQEVRELFTRIMLDESAPFSDLYSSNETVLNRRLAQYYGINSASNGDDDWVVTTTQERGGVLTSGAFMINTSSDAWTRPIIRAVKIRELMMCQIVPPPVNITLPPDQQAALAAERMTALAAIQEDFAAGTLTSREYFERQTDYPACSSCHQYIINPLFGVEDFDAYGLPRSVQNGVKAQGTGTPGLPVDNFGTLYGFTIPGDQTESFDFFGTKDLGDKMAELPAVKSCFTTNAVRWLTGLPIVEKAYTTDNGRIVEQVLLKESQSQAFACEKKALDDDIINNDNPLSVYRKIGVLDMVRVRNSIEPSQIAQ